MKKLYALSLAVLGGLVALLASSPVQAAITLPEEFDVAGVETIAGLMIAALAVIWVARKVKGFVG